MTRDTQTVLVIGADGYTGWPLTCRLLAHGHDVIGVDNFLRRDLTPPSVTPIEDPLAREAEAHHEFEGDYNVIRGDLTDRAFVRSLFDEEEFDTVVNLGQIPSAPYSMQSPGAAWEAQRNNVQGSLNLLWALHEAEETIPLVQLATMGEYGLPETPIPEGFLPDGRPAPKRPGSYYHASKVASTVNTLFAADTWGIPVTEVYQGIVYGVTTPEIDGYGPLNTRFDVDEMWGTVANRFTAQAAVGHPLTVYGDGGQKRAMLSLTDCVRSLHHFVEHPPDPDGPGAYPYRAVNQFYQAHRVVDLAEVLQSLTAAEIEHVENPREEDDGRHFYEPERDVYVEHLGEDPTRPLIEEIKETLEVIQYYSRRIDRDGLRPETTWA